MNSWNRAISLLWDAINAGDRVESALKDMAVVMNQLHRSDQVIEAIKLFRYLCSLDSQDSIDNLLLQLDKNTKCSREQTHTLQSPTVAQAPTHEEYALTEVMKFIYSNTLVADKEELLDILVSADRYAVSGCVAYCIQQLLNLTMTKSTALNYLNDIPWTVLMAPNVQPLVKAAQNVIAYHYRDITEHPKEKIMSLPFLAIEGIFSSDNLIIAAEDFVYNVLVAWTECNYSDPEKQKEILESLTHCIRFPYISSRKLQEILVSEDLKPEVASKLVLEALVFKTESRQRQRELAAEKTDHRFMERKSYKYRPVQLLEFEEPHDESIVYLSLKREDCASLYPSGRLYSQGFNVFGSRFHLSLRCDMDEENTHCLGLYLEQRTPDTSSRSFYIYG